MQVFFCNDKIFFVNLAQSNNKQMLKISSQYLEWNQNYCHLTEKFWQLPAYIRTKYANSYKRRRAIARIFQLKGNNSKTTQDIDLKFSAYVHHMLGLNWQKNLVFAQSVSQ